MAAGIGATFVLSCLLLLVCLSSAFVGCRGDETMELQFEHMSGMPMSRSRALREGALVRSLASSAGSLARRAINILKNPKIWKELGGQARDAAVEYTIRGPSSNSPNPSALQGHAFPADSQTSFYVQLELGSSQQKVNTTIFASSQLFWVQCKPCVNCNNIPLPPQPLFQSSSSTSFRRVACNVPTCSSSGGFDTGCSTSTATCNYSDAQSLSFGDFALDTITMSSLQGSPSQINDVAFGCGQDNGGLLKASSSSGILGLGRGNMSFLSQLKGRYPRRFSYCFPNVFAQENAVGQFFFGDYSLTVRLNYTSLIPNQLLYYVEVTSISVDGKALSVPRSAFEIDQSGNGGTVIDSAVFFTYLTDDCYLPLKEAFERSTTNLKRVFNVRVADELGLEVCYNVSVNAMELPKAPDVAFLFQGGATIELRKEHLWVPIDEDDKEATICMAFGRASSMQVGVNIIGIYQQFNLAVEYDVENSKIGFAKADCISSSTKLYPTQMGLLSIVLFVIICSYVI